MRSRKARSGREGSPPEKKIKKLTQQNCDSFAERGFFQKRTEEKIKPASRQVEERRDHMCVGKVKKTVISKIKKKLKNHLAYAF